MQRILMGLAIANESMTAGDYVEYLRKLGVIVKPGARRILMAMPSSHGLPKRTQTFEARRAPGDGEAMPLPDIAEMMTREFKCVCVAAHLVPVACIEIIQLWQALREYRHIVLFHEPIEVNDQPSILHFEMQCHGIDDYDIVLTHADALGSWDAPETLFVAHMPFVRQSMQPASALGVEAAGQQVAIPA